ncbi:MAG: sigma-70 family RNA polymerase sigma factor [Planctomycetes bacterium]|nr:sigma-70 family RNA polymerase sigma factor [Planctomycetota bacterium]
MGTLLPDAGETERLLEQARDGDRQAFERLFALYRPFVRQVVGLRLDPRLRGRLDLSDVVQETQREALRRLGDFLRRQPMPFRVWLRKTAYECLVKLREHHDAAKRSPRREVHLPQGSSLLLAQQLLRSGSSPSQQLSRRELARQVNQALARLPEADRDILLMRNFEGLAYEEVAAALEIAPAAARKRYGRALLRLQKLLTEHGLLEPTP